MFVCLFVCLFVCMYVCMYGTCTNPHFWTDLNQTLHTSPPWSGRDLGYVWTQNSWPLRPFGPFFFGGHCRIMGTRWLLARPFSAIILYPWFQLVFVWHHRHYVVADGGVICGSLMSVILPGVPLTWRKWRRSRRKPQRRIPYSGRCLRHITDITFNRATGPSATALYPSFWLLFLWPTGNNVLADDSCAFLLKCVALSVMLTIRWDVNGIHVSTIRKLIRREGSD